MSAVLLRPTLSHLIYRSGTAINHGFCGRKAGIRPTVPLLSRAQGRMCALARARECNLICVVGQVGR